MRLNADKLARLALLWSEAVGPAGLLRLVAHFGTAERVLAASAADLAAPDLGLRPEQIPLLTGLRNRLNDFEAQWDECHRRYIRVLFPDDDGYPRILRDIPNRPGVLAIPATGWPPTTRRWASSAPDARRRPAFARPSCWRRLARRPG